MVPRAACRNDRECALLRWPVLPGPGLRSGPPIRVWSPAGAAARPVGAARESQADSLAALQHLLDTGVINTEEYEEMRARVLA